MSDLTPETLAELRRRHAALTPFALRFMSGGPGGGPFITLASEDGSTPLPDPAFDAVLLFAELAAAALPALLDAAAERDELAGAWDEGADFARRHPFMSSEYIRWANPYRTAPKENPHE